MINKLAGISVGMIMTTCLLLALWMWLPTSREIPPLPVDIVREVTRIATPRPVATHIVTQEIITYAGIQGERGNTGSKGDKVVFEADSDSAITRGLIALLVKLFSGATSAEIAAADLSLIDKLGFAKHLSMSRANGFASMIATIKKLALS
jgi:hypothetical protein